MESKWTAYWGRSDIWGQPPNLLATVETVVGIFSTSLRHLRVQSTATGHQSTSLVTMVTLRRLLSSHCRTWLILAAIGTIIFIRDGLRQNELLKSTLSKTNQQILWGSSIQSSSTTTSPSFPERILFAVISYAYGDENKRYLDDLVHTLATEVCSRTNKLTMVLYTTTTWPTSVSQQWHDEAQSAAILQNSCDFRIEVRLKNPSWKNHLVHFHRQELFYNSSMMEEYDLMVYTEDDHDIRAHHIEGYWRETQRLLEVLGPTRFLDFSIGFMRYEIDDKGQQLSFEHKLDMSSIDNFSKRHVVDVPEMSQSNQLYYNGGHKYHQGMFMATPQQLRGWQHRPPNCFFHNTTTMLNRWFNREETSSLHLFSPKGCNVTQLIPFLNYREFWMHHRPNKYYPISRSYLRSNTVPVHKIGTMLRTIMENRSTPVPTVEQRLRMFDAEQDRPTSFNFTEYEAYEFR